MSRIPQLIVAIACSAALALPAAAQPLHITVPGGHHTYYYNHPYYSGYSFFFGYDDYHYFNQPGDRFDPGTASMNALHAIHFNEHPRMNFSQSLANSLARTGDSLAQHWEKCQSRYSTYDIVSDTYFDDYGMPRACGE